MSSFVPGAVGGESKPFLGYNAKARLWTIDKETKTSRLKFVADCDNAEAGWMKFAEGMAPDFQLVPVADLLDGKPYPPMPDARDANGRPLYRRGFKIIVKLPDKLAGDGPTVREFTANSLATTSAIDDLLRAWYAQRQDGKVPVVSCRDYTEVKSKQGSNFAPVFEIVELIDRPADLVANGDARPADAKPAKLVSDDEPEDFDDDESWNS
jgi:hypothetical protein